MCWWRRCLPWHRRNISSIPKHLGLFVDKKHIELNILDDSDEYLRQLMEIVNGRTVDHEPVPLQLENGHDEEDGPAEPS